MGLLTHAASDTLTLLALDLVSRSDPASSVVEETCKTTEAHSSLSLYLGRSVQYSDDINDVPELRRSADLSRRKFVLGSADVIELAATATPGQRSIRQLAVMDRSLNSAPLEHVDKVRVQV